MWQVPRQNVLFCGSNILHGLKFNLLSKFQLHCTVFSLYYYYVCVSFQLRSAASGSKTVPSISIQPWLVLWWLRYWWFRRRCFDKKQVIIGSCNVNALLSRDKLSQIELILKQNKFIFWHYKRLKFVLPQMTRALPFQAIHLTFFIVIVGGEEISYTVKMRFPCANCMIALYFLRSSKWLQ